MQAEERRALLRHALRSPRGRYPAERAAHLSGVLRRTVYDWAHVGVLVPDYPRATPKLWSYRDLVFLRLLARMRQQGIERGAAAETIKDLRHRLAQPGSDITTVRIADGLFVGDDTYDAISGQRAFEQMLDLTRPLGAHRGDH